MALSRSRRRRGDRREDGLGVVWVLVYLIGRPLLSLSARIMRALIGGQRKFAGSRVFKYGGRQLVEDGEVGMLAFAALVGEQNRVVALPIAPGADKTRFGVGGFGVETPLSDQVRLLVDPDRVFVLRGDADFLEGEFVGVGGASGLGFSDAAVAQGNAAVFEFVGQDQPVGIVDLGAVAVFELGGDGVFAVDIHKHGHFTLLEAEVVGPFILYVQTESEKAPGDIAGVVPVFVATHYAHDLVGDGFGVGVFGVEAFGGRVVFGVGCGD